MPYFKKQLYTCSFAEYLVAITATLAYNFLLTYSFNSKIFVRITCYQNKTTYGSDDLHVHLKKGWFYRAHKPAWAEEQISNRVHTITMLK